MIYEISYEWDGCSGRQKVVTTDHATIQQIVEQFRHEWEERYSEPAPEEGHCWISASWSQHREKPSPG